MNFECFPSALCQTELLFLVFSSFIAHRSSRCRKYQRRSLPSSEYLLRFRRRDDLHRNIIKISCQCLTNRLTNRRLFWIKLAFNFSKLLNQVKDEYAVALKRRSFVRVFISFKDGALEVGALINFLSNVVNN